MSYPIKYRKRVIEYRQEGHTLEETSNTFAVAISTIQRWERQLKEKGDLETKPLNRRFKKIAPKKLKEYIDEHPDAYLKEIAEVFKCSDTAIRKALKRQNITRKKRQKFIKNKTRIK